MLNNYVEYDETYEIETSSTISISSVDSYEYSTSNFTNTSIINSKYKLLIPVIFNENIHGFTSESDPNIIGQLLVQDYFIIKNNTSIGKLFTILKNTCKFYRRCYKGYYNTKHSCIRNYSNIIKRSNYIKPEIGEIYYLQGHECVCILKTFWLKIIQRAWKKIYKVRQKIFKLRCRPDSVLYRQFTGKFPETCDFMPSMRGMLAHI